MRTCQYHCRGCGRHFSGLSSFDAHRTGSFGEPKHSLTGRRCKPVERDKAFVGDQGECRVDSAQTLDAVLIWGLVADRKRLKEAFGR